MFAAGSRWRAVLAWLAAWGVIALLGWLAEQADAALGGGQWAPSGLGLWSAASGLALAIWIPFARARRWRRPIADIIVFGAGAAVAPLLFLLALWLRGSQYAELRFLAGMTASAYALYVAQVAAAFGALGGVLYWLFAGRPRPPY